MQRDVAALANTQFDLLIAGGGIVGAGIARDAALRGLRVAIVERGDWASGASSRSSKLIHGGFRYLEQGAFRLVAEACRERAILRRIAPRLVTPLPFLLPVYRGDPRSLLKMRLGMTLYDLLSMYRNTAPHRALSPTQAIEAEPGLAADGMIGAIRFFDCREDDARFCVETLLHAAELGAVCINYCNLISADRRGESLTGVICRDELTGDRLEVRSAAFVNATGGDVERVESALGIIRSGNDLRLSPTKGVHLLLPAQTNDHAIAFQSRHEGRILFIIPWNGCSLVGTTDTDLTGDPRTARPERADVDYLLDAIAPIVRSPPRRSEIITSFAGVRPLLAADLNRPSARSREHRIVHQAENLLSVAGGKYTTFRLIAEQVVDRVFPILKKAWATCRTATEPMPDRDRDTTGAVLAQNPLVYETDAVRAVRAEMARSVSDVMWRRTPLALSSAGGEDTAKRVGELLAKELSWNPGQERDSVRAYLAERDAHTHGR